MAAHVLVVGGAGYIGSHMTRWLCDNGLAVTVFDNLRAGHREAVDSRATLVVGDLLDPPALAAALACRRPQPVDAVLHFAALINVADSVRQPGDYYRTNTLGTWALLEAMTAANVRRLVFSSTAAVYGAPPPNAGPLAETHPTNPANPYGRAKLAAEAMLPDWAAAHQIASVALRYFNVAGCHPSGQLGERHDPETHLIPLVLREALRVRDGGSPDRSSLQICGDDFPTPDGSTVRDFVHVCDLCAAHGLALRWLLDQPDGSAPTRIYNVGLGRGFSVREVIDSARRVTGLDLHARVVPRREGDVPCLIADSRRLRAELGWLPQFTDLDAIIATAWRWFAGPHFSR